MPTEDFMTMNGSQQTLYYPNDAYQDPPIQNHSKYSLNYENYLIEHYYKE